MRSGGSLIEGAVFTLFIFMIHDFLFGHLDFWERANGRKVWEDTLGGRHFLVYAYTPYRIPPGSIMLSLLT